MFFPPSQEMLSRGFSVMPTPSLFPKQDCIQTMAARKGIKTTKEQLSQWYCDERKTTTEIADLLKVNQVTVIYWMNHFGIPRRSHSEALTKTLRADFSGDLKEKAYLLGFRLGDLHVYQVKEGGETIRIVCASGRMAQIQLIRSLFEEYGHIKITPKIDGNTMISCYVNMSFDFLLPKQDAIEKWILADDKHGLAFLAGYIDAEGSFGIDSNGSGNLKIESYDVTILHQLHEILTRLDVLCPPSNLIKNKETASQKLNHDLWRLGVYRKTSLDRLCFLLEPYLRHEQRRQDMAVVWQNVRERIAT